MACEVPQLSAAENFAWAHRTTWNICLDSDLPLINESLYKGMNQLSFKRALALSLHSSNHFRLNFGPCIFQQLHRFRSHPASKYT